MGYMNKTSPVNLNNIHIITDFDGTITNRDTLEALLNRFGTPEWITIEDRLEQNLLTVDDAFRQQMALMDASLDDALSLVVKTIQVDSTLIECARQVRAIGGRFSIISAGFHEIISVMLNGKMPEGVAVHANRLEVKNDHWIVIPSSTPKIKGLCTHCKRYWVEEAKAAGDFVVYVGDGYTDRCPAESADRVYARGSLLDHRLQQEQPTFEFRDFAELWRDLTDWIQKGQE
jgi:2-hydroxy-3-keto-5-methylthiopentenyl-1-phosphate phosphatase